MQGAAEVSAATAGSVLCCTEGDSPQGRRTKGSSLVLRAKEGGRGLDGAQEVWPALQPTSPHSQALLPLSKEGLGWLLGRLGCKQGAQALSQSRARSG